MAAAKSRSQEMFKRFCASSSAEDVNLKLSQGAPGFFDGGRADSKHSVISLLQARWKVSDTVNALRCALFAGCLDDLMMLKKHPKTETLVRFFDETSGTDQLEPIAKFLSLSPKSVEEPTTQENSWASVDVDVLTKEFLTNCYDKSDDFALPAWDGDHAENTKGIVRALAWLQQPPVLKHRGEPPANHEFLIPGGAPIKLVESPAEERDLQAKKLAIVNAAHGTGVNEYSPFVWCNLSLDEIKNRSFNANSLLSRITQTYNAELGTIELSMFALDHVSLMALSGKARKRGVVGPLRLSANALILDPLSGSVVIQQKREPKRSFPRHTFGGSFLVPDPKQIDNYVPGDGSDIVRCVRREILEESNIALPMSSRKPFVDIPTLLLLQTDPPFLQACFLGWQVPRTEVSQCFAARDAESSTPNSEGTALQLPLAPTDNKKLQSVAETFYKRAPGRAPWRPAGLLALYAWYCIGCPGISKEHKARLDTVLQNNNWPPHSAK